MGGDGNGWIDGMGRLGVWAGEGAGWCLCVCVCVHEAFRLLSRDKSLIRKNFVTSSLPTTAVEQGREPKRLSWDPTLLSALFRCF